MDDDFGGSNGPPQRSTSIVQPAPATKLRDAMPLKLDTSHEILSQPSPQTPKRTKEGRDSAVDLPLRTPSPSKVKTTVTIAPDPRSVQRQHRQISINLPPPKRRRVGSVSPASSPSKSASIETPHLSSPKYAPWDRDIVAAQQASQQSHSSVTTPQTATYAKRPFRLIHELCKEQELMIRIATEFLPPEDMFNLYAIDATFHYLFTSHQSIFILNSLRIWSPLWPESDGTTKGNRHANLMPFSVYHKLCNRDATRKPVLPTPIAGRPPSPPIPRSAYVEVPLPSPDRARISALQQLSTPGPSTASKVPPIYMPSIFNSHQSNAEQKQTSARRDDVDTFPTTPGPPNPHISRLVPTFRYMWFVRHRIRTINSIMTSMLFAHEFRLPVAMPHTLAKLWLLMDIPTNGARIALVHSPLFFTDDDLHRAMLFTLKLDMAFTNPYSGRGETALRKLMFAQRSLSVLEGVLRRTLLRSKLDLTRMYLRWKYRPGQHAAPEKDVKESEKGDSILGVPLRECGQLELEGWGKKWLQRGTFSWIEAEELRQQQQQERQQSSTARFGRMNSLQGSRSDVRASNHFGQTALFLPTPLTGPSAATPVPMAPNPFLQPRRPAPPPPAPSARRGSDRSSVGSPRINIQTPPDSARGHGQTSCRNSTTTAASSPQATSKQDGPPFPPTPPLSAGRPHANSAQSDPAISHTTSSSGSDPPKEPQRRLMLRPDELVLREAIHRRLGLERQFRNMMLSGYHDEKTLAPLAQVEVPEWWWEEQKIVGLEGVDLRKWPPHRIGVNGPIEYGAGAGAGTGTEAGIGTGPERSPSNATGAEGAKSNPVQSLGLGNTWAEAVKNLEAARGDPQGKGKRKA